MTKTNSSLNLALGAAALSVLVHTYLTYHHYAFWLFGATNALCVAGSLFDCNAVDASPYSEFFGWVPVALLGALANLLLVGFLLLARWSSGPIRNRYLTASFLGASFLVGASLFMGFITLTQLSKACIFCLGLYFLSGVVWFGIFANRPKNLGKEMSDLLSSLFSRAEGGSFNILIASIAIFPTAWVLNDMVKSAFAKGLDQVIVRSLAEWELNPTHEFQITDGLSYGAEPSKAKLTLVEFADFQCSHCFHAAPVLHSFVASRNDVRLIFQSFPLDGVCNPAIPSSRDGLSCDLAKAVFCGTRQNKGLAVHDFVFENFGKMTAARLPEIPEKVGLNATEFESCLKSSETHEKILEQAKRGKSAGVEGTPSIFANGKLLPAGYALPILEALYKKVK